MMSSCHQSDMPALVDEDDDMPELVDETDVALRTDHTRCSVRQGLPSLSYYYLGFRMRQMPNRTSSRILEFADDLAWLNWRFADDLVVNEADLVSGRTCRLDGPKRNHK